MSKRFRGALAALFMLLDACASGTLKHEVPPPVAWSARPSPTTTMAVAAVDAGTPSAGESPVQAGEATPLAGPYRDVAARIFDASRKGDGAWEKVAYLADQIGARLSGSPELGRAVAWARDTLEKEGHENVRLDKVRVPHWVRGDESLEILAPARRKLSVLALGGSIGTPPAGVTADVIAVSSFQELEQLGDRVKGKIVLFNHVMPKSGHPGMNYGEAIPFRIAGAMRAAPLGALAVLVRSLTAVSLGSPHTGSMRYADPPAPRIPAASVSVEDAELMVRLLSRGQPVKVRLVLGAKMLPDADSANVLAEIKGRERPDEIVLLGAHLDSWDVGQGAQDDGAGCAIVMEALTTLRRLGLAPRRTLRVVLFTNEENGVRGGKQYALDHQAELPKHVAAFEADTGAGAPLGFATDGPQPFAREAEDIASLFAPIGASTILPAFAGEDVGQLKPAGVPLFGLLTDVSHYFDTHHSAADTLDKIDPEQLRRSVAVMATMAFVVADRAGTWRGGGSGRETDPGKP